MDCKNNIIVDYLVTIVLKVLYECNQFKTAFDLSLN